MFEQNFDQLVQGKPVLVSLLKELGVFCQNSGLGGKLVSVTLPPKPSPGPMLVMRGPGPEKGADGMARQRRTVEEIINKLREAEVGLVCAVSNFRNLPKQFLMDTSWFAFAPQGAVEYRREERSEQCGKSPLPQRSAGV